MAYSVGFRANGTNRPLTYGRHEEMKDLRCMSFTSKGTAEILAAGGQDKMLVVDLIKGDVVKQVGSLVIAVGRWR